jgi:hypothetical protein
MCISRKVVVVLLLLLLPLPLLVPLPLLPTARMFRPFRPLARATFVRMFYGGPAAKRGRAFFCPCCIAAILLPFIPDAMPPPVLASQLLFARQPRAIHGAAGHLEECALLQED